MLGQKFITIRPSSPKAQAAKAASIAAQKAMTTRRQLAATARRAKTLSLPDEDFAVLNVLHSDVAHRMKKMGDLLEGLTEEGVSEVRKALTAYLEGRLAAASWLSIINTLSAAQRGRGSFAEHR